MPVATRSVEPETTAKPDTTHLIDWAGNEVEPWEQDYEDYLTSRPSREALRPYKEPVRYWEVLYPGCSLQPYPRMGAFTSTVDGVWVATNKAQEDAIREHIAISTRVDPDRLKVTPAEGSDLRFCHSPACRFITSSLFAANLHESLCGHTTHGTPRKD